MNVSLILTLVFLITTVIAAATHAPIGIVITLSMLANMSFSLYLKTEKDDDL